MKKFLLFLVSVIFMTSFSVKAQVNATFSNYDTCSSDFTTITLDSIDLDTSNEVFYYQLGMTGLIGSYSASDLPIDIQISPNQHSIKIHIKNKFTDSLLLFKSYEFPFNTPFVNISPAEIVCPGEDISINAYTPNQSTQMFLSINSTPQPNFTGWREIKGVNDSMLINISNNLGCNVTKVIAVNNTAQYIPQINLANNGEIMIPPSFCQNGALRGNVMNYNDSSIYKWKIENKTNLVNFQRDGFKELLSSYVPASYQVIVEQTNKCGQTGSNSMQFQVVDNNTELHPGLDYKMGNCTGSGQGNINIIVRGAITEFSVSIPTLNNYNKDQNQLLDRGSEYIDTMQLPVIAGQMYSWYINYKQCDGSLPTVNNQIKIDSNFCENNNQNNNGGSGTIRFKTDRDNEEDYLKVCPNEPVRVSSYFWDTNLKWRIRKDSISFADSNFYNHEQYFNFADTGHYEIQLIDNMTQQPKSNTISLDVIAGLHPNSSLQVTPTHICPGETVFFYDENGGKKGYQYAIVSKPGDTLKLVNNIEGTDLFPKTFTYHNTTSNVSFSVYDPYCNTSAQVNGTIVVDTLSTKIGTYFFMNSTGNDGPPANFADWSKQPTGGVNHVVVDITTKWTSWETGADSNFWVVFFDPNSSERGSVKGAVHFIGNNINAGTTVKAYIPTSFMTDSLAVMIAWYQDSQKSFFSDPTNPSKPTLFFNEKNPIKIKVETGNVNITLDSVDFKTLNNPLNPNNFKYDFLAGDYSTNNWQELKIYNDGDSIFCSYYDINGGSGHMKVESKMIDSTFNISLGGDAPQGCVNTVLTMKYNIINDTLILTNADCASSSCPTICNLLNGKKFVRQPESSQHPYPAGEPVDFEVYGATECTFLFPDGTKVPVSGVQGLHKASYAFAKAGAYKVQAIVKNRCGRVDTINTVAFISDKASKPQIDPNNININNNNKIPNVIELSYYNNNGGDNRFDFNKYTWVIVQNGKYDTLFGNRVFYFMQPDPGQVILVISNTGGADTAVKLLEPLIYEYDSANKQCNDQNNTKSFNYQPVDLFSGITTKILFEGRNLVASDKYILTFHDGNFTETLPTVESFKYGMYQYQLFIQPKDSSCVIHHWAKGLNLPAEKLDFTPTVAGLTATLAPTEAYEFIRWSMGDGSKFIDYPSAINYTYKNKGVYNVCAVAMKDSNDQSLPFYVGCRQVLVGEDCGVNFTPVVNGNVVSFTPTVTSNIAGKYNYWWKFGNNQFSADSIPTTYYPNAGEYNVCLTIQNTNGCQANICKSISVGNTPCKADYIAQTDSGSLTVKLDATGLNAKNFFWELGDETVKTTKSITHTFAKSGIYNICLAISDSAGCQDRVCKKIEVKADTVELMLAEFSYFVNPLKPLSVSFKNESKGNGINKYWVLGDGNIKAQTDTFTYNYAKPGVYKACLTIDNYNGSNAGNVKTAQICKDVQANSQTVICNVKANFNFFVDPTTKTITLSSKSFGDINQYFWNLGDGKTSSASTLKQTYDKPGFYLVSLSVRDTNTKCADYLAQFIQVGATDCKADFNYSYGTSNNQILFNSTSTNANLHYWMFGDGRFATSAQPTNTYIKPGIYPVSLTVSSADGTCSNNKTELVQVGKVECKAAFSYYIDSTTLMGYFTPTGVGQISEYYWIFGDGTVSKESMPVHKFKSPGYFNVSLSTYDSASGCMDNIRQQVLIGAEGVDCEANFDMIADPITKNVKFFNKSSGKNLTYAWDFGVRFIDTDKSTLENPEYNFAQDGFYNVCLMVKNEFDITNINCKPVKFASNPDYICTSDFAFFVDKSTRTVSFADKSLGTPNQWSWDFGDGSTSTDANPTHTYSNNGYYTVLLKSVNTANSCRSFAVKLINATTDADSLKGRYYYQDTSSIFKASGYPVDFVAISHGDAAKLKWDFNNDGIIDEEGSTTPTWTYPAPGNYTACLTIEDPITGESDVYCEEIKAGVGINKVSISNTNTLNCSPNPFNQFTKITMNIDQPGKVTLSVLNIHGEMVETIVNTFKESGVHTIIWNGGHLASGNYILKLETGNTTTTTKVLLLK